MNKDVLKELWDRVYYTYLYKNVEYAFQMNEFHNILELKKSVLIFCLCAEDLGLFHNPADKLSSILKKLHDLFETKLLISMQDRIKNILSKESFELAIVKDDHQF